ncbi:MAG: ribonuclease P protein component [Firmicutes bacterium]|nr:ribonuclease P protein component [Bacillota bacterium]
MEKAYRVKKSAEIEFIMKNKSSVGDGSFVIYKLVKKDETHFRFAISVPKKYGNAVERNLMKRRIREIVRSNHFLDGLDFFIIVKPKAKELNFQEVKIDLEKLFARAKINKG